MSDRQLISEEGIARVEKNGCCLGKYRVLIDGNYYCYLEDRYNCKHQSRQFVRKINCSMTICEINNQRPCEVCEKYKGSIAIQALLAHKKKTQESSSIRV